MDSCNHTGGVTQEEQNCIDNLVHLSKPKNNLVY